MKIKIFGGDNVNWSTDQDVENLEKILGKGEGIKICSRFLQSDIIVLVCYSYLLQARHKKLFLYLRLLKVLLGKKYVAVASNDIREYGKEFDKLKKYIDAWISPNSKISEFFRIQKVVFEEIPFFVSENDFFPIAKDKIKIANDLKIDYELIKDKFLIGNFQRDSLGDDLTCPKQQKNPEFLVSLAEQIGRKNFLFVLAGPRRHYLVSRFKEKGIPYIFIGDNIFHSDFRDDIGVNILDKKKMNLLYNLTDLYVVTSISEGGPKAVLESALTKTMIFSTDVGLAGDFLHQDCIFSLTEIKSLANKINAIASGSVQNDKLVNQNYEKAISRLSEIGILQKYLNLFQSISVL